MTYSNIKSLVSEAILDTTSALTDDEVDEIADTVAMRLEEEGVEIDDDDEEDSEDSEEE